MVRKKHENMRMHIDNKETFDGKPRASEMHANNDCAL
jgi:hypothetical protein